MKILCLTTSVASIFRSAKKDNEKRPSILAFFRYNIFFFLLFLLVACEERHEYNVFALEGKTMGTTYHIKAIANYRTIISEPALQIQIDKKLEEFNEVMSTYIADSELSLLNKAPSGEWHVLSGWLYKVIALSQKVGDQSQGAFDITVGPLVNLWGFGPEERQGEPTTEQIEEARKRIGFKLIELKPESRELLKNADLYIDLSAVAKGYATDVLAEQLKEFGFTDFMIEIGGEIYVSGKNPNGTPWIIGVEKPTLGRSGAAQAVSVSGAGIATSGDYRNYYEVDGKRVSHTIDPVTARPIEHSLASVTVVASTGGLADAYATALNVMGPEKGLEFALQNKLAAYFIVREGEAFNVKFTPEFEGLMIKQ